MRFFLCNIYISTAESPFCSIFIKLALEEKMTTELGLQSDNKMGRCRKPVYSCVAKNPNSRITPCQPTHS